MEMKTIKKTTKELELEITDENETILNPITEVLLQNKDVEYASYMTDSPESKKRTLYIRVKNGKPEEILLKAVKQLEDEVNTFNKIFQDKSKSKK
ncbi:MAG: DNA-directed RNA polymerase subunit L [Candidatus Thermoplasmatota archaeon]|nr:DNA-directed RNA polymerase subunit L [Candidatus Thermoplasmatota archaeon]